MKIFRKIALLSMITSNASIANARIPNEIERPQDCKSARCGGGFGGGGGSSSSKPAEDNRLPDLWTESTREKRCNSKPIPPALCAEMQNDAITSCSLNSTEIQYMRANSIVPSCSRGYLMSVCSCGCFDKSTKIASSVNGQKTWINVDQLTIKDKVFTVHEDSTTNDISYEQSALRNVVSGPEATKLFFIEVESGHTIGLSQHHGVLLASGIMITAKELKVGDKLISSEGYAVSITKISRKFATDGKVYNLLTDKDNKTGHLILANDLILGDLAWQNSYGDELGAITLRK